MEKPQYANHSELKNGSGIPWGIADVVFVYFCIFILSIIFTGAMLYATVDINKNIYSIVFQGILSVSILAIVYLIVTQKYNMPFKDAFGISLSRMPVFVNQGIMVTAIIIITTTVIGLIFSQLTGAGSQSPYVEIPVERFRWLTFLAIFFAPIVEEVFFRGFMQPAIVKRAGVFWGILITALIFGISHTQYIDYEAAIFSVFAIGLILGITRHKTGSVMPGIFAHFFNNILAVVYVLT